MGGHAPVRFVTFDDTHEAAGRMLKGEYPSGVIDWGDGAWKIGVPPGGFGTFNLELSDSKASSAEFRFYWPAVFMGIDVYNGGGGGGDRHDSFSGDSGDVIYGEAGGTRRARTELRDVSSKVIFEFKNGQELRFDNLA